MSQIAKVILKTLAYFGWTTTQPVVNGQIIGERPRPRDNFQTFRQAVTVAAITVICILYLYFSRYRQIKQNILRLIQEYA